MTNPEQRGNEGCDVCGGSLPDNEAFVTVERDGEVLGTVCSWLCLIQFGVLKAAGHRNLLLRHVEELRQQLGSAEARELFFRLVGSGER